MRILAGLVVVTATHWFMAIATISGPHHHLTSENRANVLGPVANLEIANRVVSPDGFPRA